MFINSQMDKQKSCTRILHSNAKEETTDTLNNFYFTDGVMSERGQTQKSTHYMSPFI